MLTAASLAILTGCYNDNREDLYPTTGSTCNTTNVTYSGTVSTIMATSCALPSCHNTVASASGYDLSNYAGVKRAVDNARLLGVINHQTGYSPMPRNQGKMAQCSIDQITSWVNAGAPNN